MGSLFSPLLPDDYLELINPLWSTQELRGRIERIEQQAGGAVTLVIRPGWEWEGHEPGQYLRIGVVVDGVHHWRAYSLTSEPDRPDGYISITPKLVEEGTVSPHLVRQAKPGAIVRLGGVEGSFVLPDPVPDKLLFISAGSGVTPIMSMLRSLDRRDALDDVVHLHSDRSEEWVIFGDQLRELDQPSRRPPHAYPAQRRAGPHHARQPRGPVPGLARARDLPLGPRRDARHDDRACGSARATPSACTPSASSPRRSPASPVRAARSASSRATRRPRATARSRSSSPARTPASSCRSAAARASATPASASSARDRSATCETARSAEPRVR